MNTAYQLPELAVISVTGQDSIKVLNGLCTAKLVGLQAGQAAEAMFTDDRGRVLAHSLVALEPSGSGSSWVFGTFSQAAKLVGHIDRFIFREAAVPRDVTAEFSGWLVDGDQVLASLQISLADDQSLAAFELASMSAWVCRCPIISSRSCLYVIPKAVDSQFEATLRTLGVTIGTDNDWQSRRVANFWPLETTEITDRTLPQELDRDARAISFTKGCYLGQETVARLDALGEVQKKLCLVELDGWAPEASAKLMSEEKEVGALTSVAPAENDQKKRLALAYMKRGWMKVGSRFSLVAAGESPGILGTGTVIPHP